MKKNKKIIISITGIVLVALILIGLTYAYFLTQVTGNSNNKSVSVTTANLSLTYNDGNGIIELDKVKPNVTDTPYVTKTFSVYNGGNVSVEYGVFLENVTNTFTTKNDLPLVIECSTSQVGNTCDGYDDIMLTTNDMLFSNEIEAGETQTYTLTLDYVDSGIDQSTDMGKTASGKIQIYGLNDTVDLSGTISDANSGDYIVVESTPKRSEIINGEFKVVGLEPGTHHIKVYNSSDTLKYQKEITLNKRTTESINGTNVSITDITQNIFVSIDMSNDIIEFKIADYFMHISFDDVEICLNNLKNNNYNSLFDEPFFNWLKDLHDDYGAVFSLYTYNNIINNVPNTYANEFQNNSDWLKFGLHADSSSSTLTDYSYTNAKNSWNTFVSNVIRVTGTTNSIDRMPRLHYFAGNENALKGFKDANSGALGFLSSDDNRISYYFDSSIRDYLYNNDHITDTENNLVFISTKMRADWFLPNFSSNNQYKTPTHNNMYDELEYRFNNSNYSNSISSYILFGHEVQFYSNSTVSNIGKQLFEDACKFVKDNNYSFDYPQNRSFSSTPYDISSTGSGSSESSNSSNNNETQNATDTIAGFNVTLVKQLSDIPLASWKKDQGFATNFSGISYSSVVGRANTITDTPSKTGYCLDVQDKSRIRITNATLAPYIAGYMFSGKEVNDIAYNSNSTQFNWNKGMYWWSATTDGLVINLQGNEKYWFPYIKVVASPTQTLTDAEITDLVNSIVIE